ncbi:MAG: type II toxin-antitoxin system prevent-host-death family antitoxin [Terriglobales bacterium]
MEKSISASDASRKFLRLLRDVREGQSYVVTSHGRPVAHIAPVRDSRVMLPGARDSLLSRLRSQQIVRIGRWKRDELYD